MRIALAAVFALLTLIITSTASAAAPHGWKLHVGKPGLPAVLLVHGLASSTMNWTNPGNAWNIRPAHFNHSATIGTESGVGEHAREGVVGFVVSPIDGAAGENGSFWTYLTAQGFTVATWDQSTCIASATFPSNACLDTDLFDPAFPSAKAALEELARLTPPEMPIAIIGHSRGGLVARRLLKEKNLPGVSRVRWYVSLHTPHQGSSFATRGTEIQRALGGIGHAIKFDGMPKLLQSAASKLLPDLSKALDGAIDGIVKIAGLPGAKELAEGGPLYQDLERGETKLPGVTYVTFGGTSPRIAHLYVRAYTLASAEPHRKKHGVGTEYHWSIEPHQVLDFPHDLKMPVPEMQSGVGDLMVTDKSSHFRFEDKHFTNALNHAEVLWNRDVQRKVVEILIAR